MHTSSAGSVTVYSSCFLLWPWQEEPKHLVQAINDDDELIPKVHKDFFSNYGYTKQQTEILVRRANDVDGLRTGCLRPGNGIFGAGGDMFCGAYLVQKRNPTWIQDHRLVVHICGNYPQPTATSTVNSKFSTEKSFPHLSPTVMLLLAYLFEFLYLTHHLLYAYEYPFLAV